MDAIGRKSPDVIENIGLIHRKGNRERQVKNTFEVTQVKELHSLMYINNSVPIEERPLIEEVNFSRESLNVSGYKMVSVKLNILDKELIIPIYLKQVKFSNFYSTSRNEGDNDRHRVGAERGIASGACSLIGALFAGAAIGSSLLVAVPVGLVIGLVASHGHASNRQSENDAKDKDEKVCGLLNESKNNLFYKRQVRNSQELINQIDRKDIRSTDLIGCFDQIAAVVSFVNQDYKEAIKHAQRALYGSSVDEGVMHIVLAGSKLKLGDYDDANSSAIHFNDIAKSFSDYISDVSVGI
jgi:hypothetical protein